MGRDRVSRLLGKKPRSSKIMISSVTDICNIALGHLGEARITSLEEDSVAARACSLHYAAARDEVLRSHRWNFAAKRAVLSRLAAAPAFGWQWQYELPVDCLRVLEVNDSEVGDVISDEYLVEGRALLTNAGEVRLVYLRRIENVALFDVLFVKALALRLAMELSETIRGTTAKTAELQALYERVTAPLARRVDANEGRRRKGLLPMNSLALRERGTGGTWFGGGVGSSGHAGAVTDAELQALANLESAADKVPYFTAPGAAALASFTGFGRSLVSAGDASAGRAALGLGAIATQSAPLGASFGGTGNSFVRFTGPSSAERIFTLPNAHATVLTKNTAGSLMQDFVVPTGRAITVDLNGTISFTGENGGGIFDASSAAQFSTPNAIDMIDGRIELDNGDAYGVGLYLPGDVWRPRQNYLSILTPTHIDIFTTDENSGRVRIATSNQGGTLIELNSSGIITAQGTYVVCPPIANGGVVSFTVEPTGFKVKGTTGSLTSVIALAVNSGPGGRIGFFNTTPVAQQTGDLGAALASLGLVTAGTLPIAKITGIASGASSLNFPSLVAGAEATLTITVTGVAATNTPSVALGWSAALEDGIVVKEAWVSGANTVSVRVRNGSAGTIDPAAVTCRATVFSF